MTVHFIGAGPGAADLLAVRAVRLIAHSRTCLYAGSLVPPEVLEHVPAGAHVVDTQHLTLDEIVGELTRAHARRHDVARLHSGDLSVFSAAAEQMRRLDALGIPYDITPGVPAFAACAAALGRELTVPGVAQTVILTRHQERSTQMPPGEELAALAAHGATLVIHLGARAIDRIAATLTPAYGADCPAAVVAHASRPDELVLRGTLGTIAHQAREVRRGATIIVGPALGEHSGASHLYSAARIRPARSTTSTSTATGAPPSTSSATARALRAT